MPVLSPAGEALAARREELLQRIAPLGDLRPGSLVRSYRKCGKPNCRCTRPGHGRRWILTHRFRGKTRKHTIPPDQLEATRAQLAECQRLRHRVAALIEVSGQVCQAHPEAGGTANEAMKTLCASIRPRHRIRARALPRARVRRQARLGGSRDLHTGVGSRFDSLIQHPFQADRSDVGSVGNAIQSGTDGDGIVGCNRSCQRNRGHAPDRQPALPTPGA